ncbi:MAG: HipA domain-containing protein [Terricaulis sp.]
MSPLLLDVRLDGFDEPIGHLARDAKGTLAFAYTKAHQALPDALALSLSLPLNAEGYTDDAARPFFHNLLQERLGALDAVIEREKLSREDIAGILFHIGRDCPGAVSVLPHGAPACKIPGDLGRDYELLDDKRLGEIVRALNERTALPGEVKDPSPLAGMQSKIALTLLPDGRFGEPRTGSGAPTTHILKAPDRDHPRDASFEAAAMDLSTQLGFSTAEARVLRVREVDVLLATRFDRAQAPDGRIVRLHQEDFAQALGLAPNLKYERRGQTSHRFDVAAIRRVLERTLDPDGEKERFAAATIFDMMIGNCDGHAKNHAVIHHPNGAIVTSPRYDIMPTRLDDSVTEAFAFTIGQAKELKDLSPQDLPLFLAALGLKPDAQQRVLTETTPAMGLALVALFADLDRRRLKRFADLIAGNVEIIFEALNLPVPAAIADRDLFVGRGGGW